MSLIQNYHCEIAVAQHCNLSCRACTHLAPVLPREFVDPDRLRRDLAAMAKVYHASYARLLGGEPLLHPDLLSVVGVVRDSGIADKVEVWTNGVLLWKMSEAFWRAVDEVAVSVYPNYEMTAMQLRLCHQRARRNETVLRLMVADEFRESYSEAGSADSVLVEKIYQTCLAGSCHNIEKGFFFKCPQSVSLPRVLTSFFSSPQVDGLRIEDSPTFGDELRAFLESSRPLASCAHCLGSVGKAIPHSQVRRSEWRQRNSGRLEEMVDYELLSRMEVKPEAATYSEARPRQYLSLNSRRTLLKYMRSRYGTLECLKTAASFLMA